MKEINIDGNIFQYKTYTSHGEYSSTWTEFYQGTEIQRRKRYWLFGSIIEKDVPKFMFRINEDTDDPRLNKDWWRSKIQHEISLLNREQEIEKGELI